MSKTILICVIPANLLILFCIYKDIETVIIKYLRIKNAKKNLLNEVIEINLSKKEIEMLDDLSKGNRRSYLRNQIKETISNANEYYNANN